MSTTVTMNSGVRTRQGMRSSSEQLRPMDEMTMTIEHLARRRKGAVKRVLPEVPDEDAQPDYEVLPSSPLGDPFTSENSEQVAQRVWNEMFEGDAYRKVVEGSKFMQRNVSSLLESAQLEILRAEVMEEVERRKATFIRTESNDAARLSEKLHKMFTTILIRRVKYEP